MSQPVFPSSPGLPDPKRLECHVQHPWHAWDFSCLHKPRDVWPGALRYWSGREQKQSLQLRAIRWWRSQVHRPWACLARAQNTQRGAVGHGRVDASHRDLSQHANSADRSPSQRTPRPFQLQELCGWEKPQGVHFMICELHWSGFHQSINKISPQGMAEVH